MADDKKRLTPKRFQAIADEKTKFFEVWELEQSLLGQNEDSEESNTADPNDTRNTITADEKKALKDSKFIIPETGPGYFQRGLDSFNKKKTLGLALSGGGVRAAAFSLGVMQGLNIARRDTDQQSTDGSKNECKKCDDKPREATLLNHVDYLSTVSGGGYAGSALTYYRYWHEQSKDPAAFNYKYVQEIKRDVGEEIDFQAFPKPEKEVLNRKESRLLDFTRFRKNHLTPTTTINFLSLAAAGATNILLAWPIYLALLTAAILVVFVTANLVVSGIEVMIYAASDAGWINEQFWHSARDAMTGLLRFNNFGEDNQLLFALIVGSIAALILVSILLGSTIYSELIGWREESQYRDRRQNQVLFGILTAIIVASITYFLVPILSTSIAADPWEIVGFVIGGNTIAGVSLMTLRQGAFAKRILTPRFVLILSAGAILFGNLIIAFNTARVIANPVTFEQLGGSGIVYATALGFVSDRTGVRPVHLHKLRLPYAHVPGPPDGGFHAKHPRRRSTSSTRNPQTNPTGCLYGSAGTAHCISSTPMSYYQPLQPAGTVGAPVTISFSRRTSAEAG